MLHSDDLATAESGSPDIADIDLAFIHGDVKHWYSHMHAFV